MIDDDDDDDDDNDDDDDDDDDIGLVNVLIGSNCDCGDEDEVENEA